MSEFEIFTPSIRYDNVKIIYRSLVPFVNKGYDIRWTIVYDSTSKIFFPEIDEPWVRQFSYHENGGVAGNHQRNHAVDNIDGDGILFSLDDDTIIHPDFFSKLREVSIANPAKRGFLFHDQLSDDSIIKALPNRIKEGCIGNQNFAVKRSLIGMRRMNIHYCADGEYIEQLYKQNPNEFIFIDKVLALHNRLLWRTDWEEFIVKE
jgi:glycosyltransferase involved in cell wall biosynthesis